MSLLLPSIAIGSMDRGLGYWRLAQKQVPQLDQSLLGLVAPEVGGKLTREITIAQLWGGPLTLVGRPKAERP